MRSRLSDPPDPDLAHVPEPPDFEAIENQCAALVDKRFKFAASSDDVAVVTDAFYSLQEGVDAVVCEYVRLKDPNTTTTCTLTDLLASADWLACDRD